MHYVDILVKGHKSAQDVQSFASNRNIKWKFIIPAALWWGGFYERMIQLVKRSLRKVLNNRHISFEELRTILLEIELFINDRPLTYVHDTEVDEPITPNRLLFGRNLIYFGKASTISEYDGTQETISRRHKHVKGVLLHFTNRFKHEYYTTLRERSHKRVARGYPEISKGDVVLIGDDRLKRLCWKIGVVCRVVEG